MSNNSNEGLYQGYLLGGILMVMGLPVWPIHIFDPAKSNKKPYPYYRGSARVEGSKELSLYEMFIKHGFQPCVLKLMGVKLIEKATGVAHAFKPKDGLYVCALVRYSEAGRPTIRIITSEAEEHIKVQYGWNRQPVKALGATDQERYAFVKKVIASTRRQEEVTPKVAPTQQADVVLEQDPFAA